MHRDLLLTGDVVQRTPDHRFEANAGAIAGDVNIVRHQRGSHALAFAVHSPSVSPRGCSRIVIANIAQGSPNVVES